MGTKIEWTDKTWNPVTGCTKISPGCKNCYAEKMAKRLQTMGGDKYRNGFKVTTHPHTINDPLNWKKPSNIFVCSMSDIFHESVPGWYIRQIFETMNDCPQHTFQVLTKRPYRIFGFNPSLNFTPNIWFGTSIENEKVEHRMNGFGYIGALVKFLSLEPLLGPLPNLDLAHVDWVIVGGESGPGARPMKPEWVIDIRDQCIASGTPFFFKQWGGTNKKKAGRTLEGRTWDEMPRNEE